MATTVATNAPGRAIGRHTLVELIARGGQQEVWRTAEGLVLKQLRLEVAREIPQLATTDLRCRQMEKVADSYRALADVPGLERLIESGNDEAAGEPFQVFAAIEGERLDRWVARRTPAHVELERMLSAIGAAALTLAEMHQRRFAHHDLHPSNILVSDDGSPTLIDLGICLRLDTAAPQERIRAGAREYMAPERLRHARWELGSPASDVYELAKTFDLSLAKLDNARAALSSRPLRRLSRGGVSIPWIAEVRELLAPALQESPSARPTARELAMAAQALLGRTWAPTVRAGTVPSSPSMEHQMARTTDRLTGTRFAGLPRRVALLLGIAGVTMQAATLSLALRKGRPEHGTPQVQAPRAPITRPARPVPAQPAPVRSDGEGARDEGGRSELDAVLDELQGIAHTMSSALEEPRGDAVPQTRPAARAVAVAMDSAPAPAAKPCQLVEVVVQPDGWRSVRPCPPGSGNSPR